MIKHEIDFYVNHVFKAKRRYIDYFFSLNCASDLMNLHVFPNAKEITESLAMYIGIRKHFGCTIPVDSPCRLIYVIADGSTPRTGALLAFLTKWTIFSIDPQMKDEWLHNKNEDKIQKINRLNCYRSTIEDIYKDLPCAPDLLVLVHPHVDYQTVKSCYPATPMIVMPCCIPYPQERACKIYTDYGCWSAKNQVYIYRN